MMYVGPLSGKAAVLGFGGFIIHIRAHSSGPTAFTGKVKTKISTDSDSGRRPDHNHLTCVVFTFPRDTHFATRTLPYRRSALASQCFPAFPLVRMRIRLCRAWVRLSDEAVIPMTLQSAASPFATRAN
eukprot:6687568-Prymnesium_polylepis.2